MLPQVLLFLFGFFIQLVSADTLFDLLQPHGLVKISNSRVYRRQAPAPAPMAEIPAQCKSDCDPVLAIIGQSNGQGCSPAQCCQNSFVTGYFNCLKCAGAAKNITDYGPAQEVLDELTAACDARGLNVPKQTLPGIDPNRPLPSAPTLPSGPSASNQQTVTGLPTTIPSLTPSTSAPTSTTSASSAISTRFFTAQFSHLIICSASFVVLAHFL